jgi:hypothetical protein
MVTTAHDSHKATDTGTCDWGHDTAEAAVMLLLMTMVAVLLELVLQDVGQYGTGCTAHYITNPAVE